MLENWIKLGNNFLMVNVICLEPVDGIEFE